MSAIGGSVQQDLPEDVEAGPSTMSTAQNPSSVSETIEDIPTTDNVPDAISLASTDYEYMSDHSPYYSTTEDEIPIGDRKVVTHLDMGEAIAFAFPVDEYEDDEERDIFDDGLTDDESNYSDMSSNYEELTEPDIITRVEYIKSELDSEASLDDSEDAYNAESDTTSDSEAPEGEVDGNAAPPQAAAEPLAIPGPSDTPRSLVKPLSELEDLALSRRKDATRLDKFRWMILELEEQKLAIEREILAAETDLQEAEEKDETEQADVEAALEASGIPWSLYVQYEAFCKSLDPEFGQRGGFSITCDAAHNDSYVSYDPEFELFKEYVEIPYTNCNFRSEASSLFKRKNQLSAESAWELKTVPDYAVEFWPIKCPEPLTGGESTWGEQYPELYELAINAVRDGSESAMEMLVNLPDMNATFDGGWLFEYARSPVLKDDSIIGKRWKFRSAHKIDAPVTVEGKRQRLELMLRPENIH